VKLSALLPRAQKLAIDNSPHILTVIGVVGTVTTAVLVGKASYKACEIIRDETDIAYRGLDEERFPLSPRQKFELTWMLFIPAVGTGALTVAAILGSNRISASRAAGLAAAYSLSERAFEEYTSKVIERIGPRAEQEVRDDIARDLVKRTPQTTQVILGGTDVLCLEAFTGRYFRSDMQTLRKAANDLNEVLLHDGYVSLSDFYERIGLPETEMSDEVGWKGIGLIELQFSAVMADNEQPCMVVGYRVKPVRGYHKFG
jgi:hypothetical protein